ncbi:polysaccharide biosynthesis family protein, partial [Escherichia coli]
MIKRNALSNLVGRIWGIISLFIFIPFYISYLGSTGYGYIGFYNTLVALLAFADLGFSAAT